MQVKITQQPSGNLTLDFHGLHAARQSRSKSRSKRPVKDRHLRIIERKRNVVKLIEQWYRNYTTRRELRKLQDHQLDDVGLDRLSAHREGDKPFWRN